MKFINRTLVDIVVVGDVVAVVLVVVDGVVDRLLPLLFLIRVVVSTLQTRKIQKTTKRNLFVRDILDICFLQILSKPKLEMNVNKQNKQLKIIRFK